MVANIKYYVVTIVSIFLAISIGIFIGFMLNAQDLLTSQKEDIVSQLEERFDYLKDENQKIKNEKDNLIKENKNLEEFNKIVYSEAIKNKLPNLKIAIIETSDDYVYSGINQSLELSGAIVSSSTTIKDSLISNKQRLNEIYKEYMGKDSDNIQKSIIKELTQSIISGEATSITQVLNEEGFINISGIYDNPVDYIILAGGSEDKINERYKIIDENIIEVVKLNNIPIVGIEKENVKYSYIDFYKNSRISSVDNVDSIIGKTSLILTMTGYPGNYGVKPSSESLAPTTTPTSTE